MSGLGAGTQTLLIIGFLVFVALCVFLCVLTASDRDDAVDFYTGGRGARPSSTGLAMAGECVSAVTLLSVTGVTALAGFDGLAIAVSCVTGLALMALLTAAPLAGMGRLTVGDALARRFPDRSVRLAYGLLTLMVCLPLLIDQLAAVGGLVGGLLDVSGAGARQLCIVVLGLLMVSMTVTGGMRGTGQVQVVKVVVLSLTTALVALVLLGRFGWNPAAVLSTAAAHSGAGTRFLGPGLEFGGGTTGVLERVGQLLATAAAMAVLPQLTMRVFTLRERRSRRSALRWALGQAGGLYAVLGLLGLGATAVVGAVALRTADPSGAVAVPALARELDPSGLLLTAVACATFLTILSAVASITLAAAIAVTHDVYGQGLLRGGRDAADEVRAARWLAGAIGTVAVVLAALCAQVNLVVLPTIATTLAASALAPLLMLGLLWPGFTRRGALWAICGGSAASLVAVAVSPYFSGDPTAVFPQWDFRLTDLHTPGLLGFALGWLGSVTGRRRGALPAEGLAELEGEILLDRADA